MQVNWEKAGKQQLIFTALQNPAQLYGAEKLFSYK